MRKKFVFIVFIVFLACSSVFGQDGVVVPQPEMGQGISLDIKGMDIVDVLKMLALKAGLNIVIDKNVAGRVTVFLKDIDAAQAMGAILASNGLVRKDDDGIARIMTQDSFQQLYGYRYGDAKQMLRVKLKHLKPANVIGVLNQMKSGVGNIVIDEVSGAVILFDTEKNNGEMARMIEEIDQPLETAVFELNYAQSQKVSQMCQDIMTQGVGQVKIDERTNKLIVTDYASKIPGIRRMVLSLDDRTREVLIDAKIVQIALNDKMSLGIDWEYLLNQKFDIKGMFDQVISTTGNKWTIGKAFPSKPNDYKVILEVLETVGETKILSSPRLTVINNEEARILVGSKQVYVTTAAIQSQATTETAEAVNFVDVGVKLTVKPAIGADGFIGMRLGLEVSSATQNYQTSSGNLIPIVETSEATTTVLVRDGQTIVIGGLIKDENYKTVNKIPVLGDLPLLGALFSNKIEEKKKTELVIFLTCHLHDFSANTPS
ncbi:MAG: secretin N-terminal domain-containing protein [Candidatus Omnitrophota bacterium]